MTKLSNTGSTIDSDPSGVGADELRGRTAQSGGVAEAVEHRALSQNERRFLFLSRSAPEAADLTIVFQIAFIGRPRLAALQQAVGDVVRRHPLLRARLSEIDGAPFWAISPDHTVTSGFAIPVTKNLGTLESVQTYVCDFAQSPIPLDGEVLWRTMFLDTGSQDCRLLCAFHQVIFDEASVALFAQDLESCYAVRAGCPLPSDKNAQISRSKPIDVDHTEGADLKFWVDMLHKPLPQSTLPEDYSRPIQPSRRGASITRELDGELTRRISDLCVTRGILEKPVFVAAIGLTLAKLLNMHEVVIGTPEPGRSNVDGCDEVGQYANVLPLRLPLKGEQGVIPFLTETQDILESVSRRGSIGFDDIVQASGQKRDLSRNPLFQLLVDHTTMSDDTLKFGDAMARVHALWNGTAAFDLSVLVEKSDKTTIQLIYAHDLYRYETIEGFFDRFVTILSNICDQPEALIANMSILPERERAALQDRYDVPQLVSPFGSIPEMIASSVRAHPDKLAVRSEARDLSYAELDDLSNRIASFLTSRGVNKGTKVGLFLERSSEVVACLLGILKLGAIYVPIDIKYPAERVGILLRDAPCGFCLVGANGPVPETLPEECTQLVIGDEAFASATLGVQMISEPPQSNDIAYLIYTSGSTGLPKGIRITHGNVVNLLEWMRETFSTEDLACVAATTSLNFDMSIFEIFGTLAAGGTLLMLANAFEIFDSPFQHEITLIDTVPSAIAALLPLEPDLRSCRVINLGGEALPRSLCDHIYDYLPDIRLCNLYGPSETTTFSTCSIISKTSDRTPDIGMPLRNTNLLILTGDGTLTPDGMIGELYIGGAGVTAGYLNRDSLTREKYVTVDWVSKTQRFFRTGDLVSWGWDGELRYHGRMDHQVKVRGHRVELGEIDAALIAISGVGKAATVGLRSDTGTGVKLATYYVGEVDPKDLRATLTRRLPDYMVPRHFVQLDALPLNSNGKLDRARLPAPTKAVVTDQSVPGEDQIATICGAILGRHSLDTRQSFFDLGGGSMDLVQVVEQIGLQTGVSLPLHQVFQAISLKDIARLTDQAMRKGGLCLSAQL